jgi:hypothetical protein
MVMDAGRRTLDRETQPVQASGGGRLALEMKLFRKEGVQRLLNRLQIRAYRNQRREHHIAAGAADTVKSNVFFHNTITFFQTRSSSDMPQAWAPQPRA